MDSDYLATLKVQLEQAKYATYALAISHIEDNNYIINNCESEIKTMLRQNSDLLSRNNYGIFVAACEKERLGLVKYLLDLGVNNDILINSALHQACEKGKLDLMILLLMHGAKMDEHCEKVLRSFILVKK